MQIKVTRAHKVIMSFSTIALILKIVAVASPGWFRVEYYMKDAIIPKDGLIEPEGDSRIIIDKRSAESSEEQTDGEGFERHGRHHHRHHRHHHHHELAAGERRVTMSFGLFYFVTCVKGKTLASEEYHKCQRLFYCQARKEAEKMPKEFEDAGLHDAYYNLGEVAKYVLMEVRVEVGLGIICSLIAVVFGVRYVRNYFDRRNSGLTTVICHIIAGVVFAVVVGRMITGLVQARYMAENFSSVPLHFGFPCSILLSGIAAFITLTSSFFLLLTLSKGGRVNGAMPYVQASRSGPSLSFGMIAPPGYEPFHGLSDKEMIKKEEQADKLPEKQPL